MISKLSRKVGLSLFSENLKNYEPADPLYETYVDKKGKTKQRKRDLPPGLSKRDAKILRKVKSRAHRLDKGFVVCGMRFGWTFFIGIIPMAGDLTNAYLNHTLVVKKAKQAQLPDWLISRMVINNMISFGVGFIPVVGDIMLASYKANSRNAALLEEYLRIRGEEFLKAEANRMINLANTDPGGGQDLAEIPTKKRRGFLWFRKGKEDSVQSGASGASSQGTAVSLAEVGSAQ